MFGLFFGAMCLLGLVYVLRRPYAFAHGGWSRGWHGRHRFRGWVDDGRWGDRPGAGFGPPGRARMMLRWVYERLGTSPAQETVLADAAEAVAGAARGLRGEWEQTRNDLARALRSEPYEAEALRTAFARHDERIRTLRDVLATQATRVHEVLDARQRAELADLLERSSGRDRWNA
ncbi:MAG TPA: periplasmic heavy metal sensor [Myxococcaceae bacterium]|jgi:hypothetical protein|nr:periplasmic heavy metal sensor [Myxococcaceae bacterium]